MSPDPASVCFSIIIPTCGRVSLQHTLNSLRTQELLPGDEIIVVTDGPQPLAAELFRRAGLPGRCITTAATRDFGGTQRNHGMQLARGDYLLFMDDDDVYADGALTIIRAALREAPDRPHVFRMRYNDGRFLWDTPRLELGNISTQMFVVPRHPSLTPWDSEHGHDFRFLQANQQPGLVWREEIIALIRPHESWGRPVSVHDQAVQRTPDDCCFRSCIGATEARALANCRLPAAILEAESLSHYVPLEACEACCASWPSSTSVLNPVTATHLYSVTEQLIQHGGAPGCTVERAKLLQSWAEMCLATEEG